MKTPSISNTFLIRTALSSACIVLLASCGGGGGGSSTPAPPSTSLELALSDTFTKTFDGTGFGVWSSAGGGDGGTGDGGGGAGDGEFVKIKIQFPYAGQPNGTLTWTILKSQYGIAGSTGVLTFKQDAAVLPGGTGGQGGYIVTGSTVNGVVKTVSAKQSNIFISKNGLVTTSLPLPIGTGTDAAFSGIRFLDATTPQLADYAGQYVYVRLFADVGTGANKDVDGGVINLNADGTGRVCDGVTAYSPTCTDGFDITSAFTDSSHNVVAISVSAAQSVPFASSIHPVSGTGFFVAKKFGTNSISFTADLTVLQNDNTTVTGALYASRITGASPVNLASLVGSYNITGTVIAGGPLGPQVNQFSIKNIGGVIKGRGKATPSGCDTSETFSAGPMNGVAQSQGSPGGSVSYFFQIDTDTIVFVESQQNMGLARKYSSSGDDTPCPAI